MLCIVLHTCSMLLSCVSDRSYSLTEGTRIVMVVLVHPPASSMMQDVNDVLKQAIWHYCSYAAPMFGVRGTDASGIKGLILTLVAVSAHLPQLLCCCMCRPLAGWLLRLL